MLVTFSDGDKMEGFGNINIAEVLGSFDVAASVPAYPSLHSGQNIWKMIAGVKKAEERTRMLDPAHLALLLLPLLHTPLCLLPRHALNWQRDNEIKIQDNPPAR